MNQNFVEYVKSHIKEYLPIYFYGKRKDHLTVRLERGGTDSPYEYQAE